jgi:hypothetical protein
LVGACHLVVSLVVTRRRRDSLFAAFSIFFQTKIKFQICNSIELVFPKSTGKILCTSCHSSHQTHTHTHVSRRALSRNPVAPHTNCDIYRPPAARRSSLACAPSSTNHNPPLQRNLSSVLQPRPHHGSCPLNSRLPLSPRAVPLPTRRCLAASGSLGYNPTIPPRVLAATARCAIAL